MQACAACSPQPRPAAGTSALQPSAAFQVQVFQGLHLQGSEHGLKLVVLSELCAMLHTWWMGGFWKNEVSTNKHRSEDMAVLIRLVGHAS